MTALLQRSGIATAQEREAALRAYLDDSGDAQARAMTIAGYVGPSTAWNQFECYWLQVLKTHGLQYFHMNEIADPHSALHKFYGKHSQSALAALLGDLARAIARPTFLHGVGCVVPRDDLLRFNRARDRNIEPLALALFVCIALMQVHKPGHTIEVMLDRITKPKKQIALAMEYLATSPKVLERGIVSVVPANCDHNTETVRPLQAADFLAYETFRKFERLEEFLNTVPGLGAESGLALWYEYEDWLEKKQLAFPYERKSFTALCDATTFDCPILTYRVLCEEDDARNGCWS